jgi:uncharacterized protein YndB with AHSA1/START domain
MTNLIEREVELPWSAEEVWRALTDRAWLESWLAEEAVLELWPGGDARFIVDGEPRSGWVEEATAPGGPDGAGQTGRLAFWWQSEDSPASQVSIELSTLEAGTRLRIVEARPLEVLDLVGVPLPGLGGQSYGPALVAA